MEAYFFSLEPDPDTSAFIQTCKRLAAERVGNQLYLQDAPHLTLYVGSFLPEPSLEQVVEALLPSAALHGELAGWSTFQGDPVTGGQTLVLALAEKAMAPLRLFQERLVTALQPFRKPGLLERYRDQTSYTPEMLQSLQEFGFPFVGSIWKAHLTIASFSPEAYEGVAEELQSRRPPAAVHFPALAFNRIAGERVECLNSWALRDD